MQALVRGRLSSPWPGRAPARCIARLVSGLGSGLLALRGAFPGLAQWHPPHSPVTVAGAVPEFHRLPNSPRMVAAPCTLKLGQKRHISCAVCDMAQGKYGRPTYSAQRRGGGMEDATSGDAGAGAQSDQRQPDQHPKRRAERDRRHQPPTAAKLPVRGLGCHARPLLPIFGIVSRMGTQAKGSVNGKIAYQKLTKR